MGGGLWKDCVRGEGNPMRLQKKAYCKRLMGSKKNLIVQFYQDHLDLKENTYIYF